MDRHDLAGATAEQVMQAHLSDLGVEARYGVQFLSYWFDADNGAAFCLARAPRPDDMQAVHREAHGLTTNEIISVSEDNVLRFLGKITNPVETPGTSAFRTILFTDLEGSTALLQDVGESAYMVYLTEHDLIIRRALVASRGHEVKHTGDGIMACFVSTVAAVRCATRIQRALAQRDQAKAEIVVKVRIGAAAGEPVENHLDLFGSTVQLAARLCSHAQPEQSLVSNAVAELCIGKGLSFQDLGEISLRGFDRPVRVHAIQHPGESATPAS
jgi:class 3 adenylate cyclase